MLALTCERWLCLVRCQMDPYLLNKERWPPAVKARSKCFVFPKPENRCYGQQILYLCSSARRCADNLALHHAV